MQREESKTCQVTGLAAIYIVPVPATVGPGDVRTGKPEKEAIVTFVPHRIIVLFIYFLSLLCWRVRWRCVLIISVSKVGSPAQ